MCYVHITCACVYKACKCTDRISTETHSVILWGREYHGWAVREDFHFLMETYILFEFVQLVCFTFITFKTIKSKVRLYSM